MVSWEPIRKLNDLNKEMLPRLGWVTLGQKTGTGWFLQTCQWRDGCWKDVSGYQCSIAPQWFLITDPTVTRAVLPADGDPSGLADALQKI